MIRNLVDKVGKSVVNFLLYYTMNILYILIHSAIKLKNFRYSQIVINSKLGTAELTYVHLGKRHKLILAYDHHFRRMYGVTVTAFYGNIELDITRQNGLSYGLTPDQIGADRIEKINVITGELSVYTRDQMLL